MGITTVYVLTSEVNEYDQLGEYFVKVFFKKPTINELIEFGLSKDRAEKVINGGGGRIGVENIWYFLREFKDIK